MQHSLRTVPLWMIEHHLISKQHRHVTKQKKIPHQSHTNNSTHPKKNLVEDDDKNAKTEEVSNDPLGGVVLSFLKKAAFTASVQGKITLAIHLSASTWGLVDFSLTMTVAAAIRKGDVSHPGLYITVDLSAGSKTQAGKLLTESAEKASKVINGAKASVDKAAKIDGKVRSKIGEEIKLFQLDPSDIKNTFKTEAKISARMQIYVQNIENFGFKWR